MQFCHKPRRSVDDVLRVHELFAQRAAVPPDALAVRCGDEAVTYGDLNERANRLAHHLHALGVGPDGRVAITAILATWKAAGCYVPLDTTHPEQRLAYMLRDSAPSALVTHARIPASASAQLRGALADGTAVIDVDQAASDQPAGAHQAIDRCHRAGWIPRTLTTDEVRRRCRVANAITARAYLDVIRDLAPRGPYRLPSLAVLIEGASRTGG